MINIGFIMGFIGAAIGIIIGIMIFAAVGGATDCPGEIGTANHNNDKDGDGTAETGTAVSGTNTALDKTEQGYTECTNAKTTAWTVMGILPITLFFVLFRLFGE